MDIYEALRKDHEKVKFLLTELINLDEKEQTEKRNDLVEQIRDELVPHSRAEEAVFYNSMRMLNDAKQIAMHGYKEHLEAEALLRALQTMDKLDLSWKTTARKLKNTLQHHIQEEETEMFRTAQQMFTKEEAIAMAQTFEALKPKIKKEGLMMTTIDMVANMMPPRFSQKFRKFDITQRV